MTKKKASSSKNDHGSGFKRSQKQWENSIGDHIGKFIDRMTVKDVLDLTCIGFCAYMGNEAGGQLKVGDEGANRVMGAASGILGYRLLIHEGAGVPPVTNIAGGAILASLGILNVAPALPDEMATTLSVVSPVVAIAKGLTGEPWAVLEGLSPIYAFIRLLQGN